MIKSVYFYRLTLVLAANVKLVGLAVTMLLTACQVADDPHQGGFFRGVWNLASDRYENRIKARQDLLQDQQQAQNELIRQNAALRLEQEQLKLELKEAEQKLDGLEERIRQYQNKINTEKRRQVAEKAKIRQAEADAREIRTMLKQAQQNKTGINKKETDQIKTAQVRLNGLHDLVNSLTGNDS